MTSLSAFLRDVGYAAALGVALAVLGERPAPRPLVPVGVQLLLDDAASEVAGVTDLGDLLWLWGGEVR